MDVLIVQDGGCAPGYNTVVAFLTEHFEKAGRSVFVAQEGFKSLASGQNKDFGVLVHSKEFFDVLVSVPRVTHAQHLLTQRGAAFRAERFPEFKEVSKKSYCSHDQF